MKRTEVVTLKFAVSLIKYGVEGMLCWSWQHTVDRLV